MIFVGVVIGWMALAVWLQPPYFVTIAVGFALGLISAELSWGRRRR